MIRFISDSSIDRAEINRANAQHSTGPKTEEGKHRSSLNALRHGLTGQIIVLPAEDLESCQRHVQSFNTEHKPKGATEIQRVQALADADLVQMHEFEGKPYDPTEHGFVFSNEEIEAALRLRDRNARAEGAACCIQEGGSEESED